MVSEPVTPLASEIETNKQLETQVNSSLVSPNSHESIPAAERGLRHSVRLHWIS